MWPVELGREETRRGLEDLVRPDSSVVVPGRCPESTWSRRTPCRTVSADPTPSLDTTAFIAAHSVS